MQQTLNTPVTIKNWAQIEFWIVTGFVGFLFLMGIFEVTTYSFPEGSGMRTTNITNITLQLLFRFLVPYLSYLFLCFFVTPDFQKKESTSNATLFILGFIAITTMFNLMEMYLGALLGIKILIIYFNRNKNNSENRLNYEAALLVGLWLILIILLSKITTSSLFIGPTVIGLRMVPRGLEEFVLFVIPALIIVYLYAVYSFIPKISNKRWPKTRYWGKMFWLAILSSFAIMLAIFLQYNRSLDNYLDDPEPFFVAFSNFVLQLVLIAPLAWSTYKNRQKKVVAEITSLKTELGKSDANLNFLKSQINPHFLFNSLNTLYGTALQENAERTGEGIQKLGDMMRFMLQENMENKIALGRDLAYLENYIQLQKLRTSVSEKITIQHEIERPNEELFIGPMLLIPFVENAFKHGISLVYPSYVKISLHLNGNKLYFDVSNSIHGPGEEMPTEEKSGIGLENVKQRLQLLYPGSHELIIRETAKEFFVHLTVELEGNS